MGRMADDRGGGEAGLVLHASHTHLFRGARLRAPGEPADPGHAAPFSTTTDVRVVFSDYADAGAVLADTGTAPEWILGIEAYRTAAGTEIPARAWELELLPSGGVLEFKVVARRPDPDA